MCNRMLCRLHAAVSSHRGMRPPGSVGAQAIKAMSIPLQAGAGPVMAAQTAARSPPVHAGTHNAGSAGRLRHTVDSAPPLTRDAAASMSGAM